MAILEKLNSGAALLISTATIIGMLFASIAWMDSRHASAMDVKHLAEVIRASEVARIEYMIEETERRARRILRIPENERTSADRDDLVDLEARREYLLRELKRLEAQR